MSFKAFWILWISIVAENDYTSLYRDILEYAKTRLKSNLWLWIHSDAMWMRPKTVKVTITL